MEQVLWDVHVAVKRLVDLGDLGWLGKYVAERVLEAQRRSTGCPCYGQNISDDL